MESPSKPWAFAALLFTVYVAFVVWLNLVYFDQFGISSLIAPDSTSYAEFQANRTPGYGWFLVVLGWLNAFPNAVAAVQLNLMLAATAWVAWLMHRSLESRTLGIAFFVLMAGHTGLQTQSLWLLADSLFVTILLGHIGCVILALRQSTARNWLLVGLSCAAAIFVRPSGYFLLASLGYLLIAIRKWQPALWVVLPIMVSLGGLATYNAASYGHFGTQAFGGISLYGIVAHRTEPLADHPLQELSTDIHSRLAPFAAEIEAADFPWGYQRVTSANYNMRLWDNAWPELESYVDKQQISGNRWVVMNDLASELAIIAILDHPTQYVEHIFAHALTMWRYLFATPPDVAYQLDNDAEYSNRNVREQPAFVTLRSSHPDPRAKERWSVAMLDAMRLPWRFAETLRNSFGSVTFLAALALAYLGWRRPEPIHLLAGYLGVGLQAYIVLTVLAQVALLRYAYAATPLAVATLLLLGHTVRRYLHQRTRAGA